jgi:fucose permease
MHLMPFIMAMTVAAALFGLFVGYSLMTRQSWGRILAIIAGVLVLFKPLLGTALGIYTLWVLAPSTSAMEYDSMADAGYPPGPPPR